MDFPNGGAPATGQRARESAVIISIQVGVVDHQLSNDFDLLALQRIDASKCPLRPARVRSHLSDDAGFIHFRGVAEYGLWFILQNLLRQCRVKAQADVEVIAVRELQFAIRGFPDRDRKSTRLNSSHQIISYAVFCLKKKTKAETSRLP